MFDGQDIDKMPGHWLLARMGKKVLRPGGKELTQKLIHELQITGAHNVVEFAPGLGFTASLVLQYHPLSYIGVEMDKDAIKLLQSKFRGSNITFLQGNAASIPVLTESQDRVYGEAMLTMQADHKKAEIIQEAERILKRGGLYGIHELGLMPDNLDEAVKAKIQKELSLAIKVNARPLTVSEWQQLLEANSFRIKKAMKAPMHLLEPTRMVGDEGWLRAARIAFNILTNGKARKRLLAMRRVFHKYGRQMNAVAIIAEKI
ncbi:MAG: class I SAM-dependent methyltransferase [Bacteroidetes bacterium]|nr:class I SAM-dependent methyltransferase [Bacteroidota bacterium]